MTPPAWSLNLELIWYLILLAVFVLLPARLRKVGFLLVLPVPLLYASVGRDFYFNAIGSGYAFALGALWSEWRPTIPKAAEGTALALIPIMLFALPIVLELHARWSLEAWLNAYLFPFVLFTAFGYFLRRRGDNSIAYWAGAVSYPIFLIHWPIAAICVHFGLHKNSLELLVAATLLSLLVSALIVFVVEKPLLVLRTQIRANRVVEPEAVQSG